MDKILQKLQNMEDVVVLLKEEVSTNKLKIVTLERKLKESQERIERLESEKTTPVKEKCRSSPMSGNMKQEVTAIKKQCEDVGSKCERLTKLQHILNSFILKSRDSSKMETRVESLRTDFNKLAQIVNELQTAFSRSQKTTKDPISAPGPSATAPSAYFSSTCRFMVVLQTGFLVYRCKIRPQLVGQFISAQPLTRDCPSFSLGIINSGDDDEIGIGVCPKEYAPDRMPGWIPGSIGYHSDNGGIYNGHGKNSLLCDTCRKDDIMKCQLDFSRRTITFLKNGEEVYTSQTWELSAFEGLHAIVGMRTLVGCVQLLERDPWRQ